MSSSSPTDRGDDAGPAGSADPADPFAAIRDLADDPTLLAVLAESQRRGFLGPGPLAPQVLHAAAFRPFLTGVPHDASGRTRVLDLGSGGGLPGLVLARASERIGEPVAYVLLDASLQRTTFLREAVASLGADDRVEVRRGRAEELAHEPGLRAGFDAVVARSFGAPAVTAECATAFLRPAGRLVVSEPPAATQRWDHPDGLATLALELGPRRQAMVPGAPPASFQVLTRRPGLDDRYPRRVGIPAKRPLF